MRKTQLLFVSLIMILPLLDSCKSDHYKVDVSGIKADVRIMRLEKDLFTLNPDDIPAAIPALRQKYDGFLQLFSYVINTGDVNSSSFSDFMIRFCTDKQNNDVYSQVMNLYPELGYVEKGLNDAFSNYLYYFPGKAVPKFYSCISGFNNSIITGDSVLGFSLDRYMGANCEYYPRLEIYSYMSARMTPDYIVPDCIYGWGASEWDFGSMKYHADNVITEMLHEGKLKYFEKCMLPNLPDEIIFGFTPGQMKFCRNNEGQMWQYLVENDLVFKTDHFTIRKLVGDAPFTSYFTNESPGRAAVWIGFRIVESHMDKNRGTSLENLMKNINIQEILELAKYNPQ